MIKTEEVSEQGCTCPWCAYTGSLKQVLMHMESQHHQHWCDLGLYPPIAGAGGV
jgi:hypothetical protein